MKQISPALTLFVLVSVSPAYAANWCSWEEFTGTWYRYNASSPKQLIATWTFEKDGTFKCVGDCARANGLPVRWGVDSNFAGLKTQSGYEIPIPGMLVFTFELASSGWFCWQNGDSVILAGRDNAKKLRVEPTNDIQLRNALEKDIILRRRKPEGYPPCR